MNGQTKRAKPLLLVVHMGGIGDFILTWPVLSRLGLEHSIELVGRKERMELAVAAGLARAAHDPDHAGYESVFLEPNARLRDFLARFDRALVWMKDDGSIQRGFHACGLRDVLTFPGLPPEDWPRHASEYYLHCLGIDDVSPRSCGVRKAFAAPDSELLSEPVIIIHPGSGSKKKNWPLENFLAVGEHLRQRGKPFAWVLGPAEQRLQLPPGGRVLPPTSLVNLASELARAALYIGNDSGITHLAAAAGCPTVAVFGSTDPRIWRPLGDNATVVYRKPWPTVQDILAALP